MVKGSVQLCAGLDQTKLFAGLGFPLVPEVVVVAFAR